MLLVQMGVAKVHFSEFFVVFGLLLAEDLSNQANFMTIELNLIVAYLLFHKDHTHVWETYGIKSFILFLARQQRDLCICIDVSRLLAAQSCTCVRYAVEDHPRKC